MKTVLVGTDFSDGAGKAMRLAGELAGDLGAELHVVHVHDSMLTGSDVDESFLEQAEMEQAKQLAQQIASVLGKKKVKTAILRGAPADAMLQYASQIDADYIIVGRIGRSAIADLIFGSVAKNVLKHSTIPVITVPTS